jgi:putative ABC transport system ATP-binding protein
VAGLNMVPPLISAQNLAKKYLDRWVLDQVSFQVDSGEFLAITGPSGCGKSTLLNVLGLMEAPDDGQLQFLGTEMTHLAQDQRAKVRNKFLGMVFQSFNLLAGLTVLDNVRLPTKYSPKLDFDATERALSLLDKVGLALRAKDFPQQLSGGEQQRVAVARALMMSPRLILADEPTGNLDRANSERLLEMFLALHSEGTSFIVVTHDSEVAHRAGRVITMRDGKIV